MKALTLLLALLVLAAPAGASTVRVTKTVEYDADDDFGRDDTETTTAIVRFRALPGEANRVLVRRRGRRVVFTDRGARLQAGKRCTSKGVHRAVCRVNFYADARFLSVGLGDRDDRAFAGRGVGLDASWYPRAGDDHIRGTAGGDYVTAGPGDDAVRGAGGRDNLLGGEGADRLAGGEAADTLVDGAGSDELRAGPGNDTVYSRDGASRDRLDGGRDSDLVTYSRRRDAVDAALNGPGEDRLRHFEALTGGDGDDILTGDDAANAIDGGDGADRMDGRGGDDRFGVSFEDADEALCGAGNDRIRGTSSSHYLVQPDCERVNPAYRGLVLANPVAATADSVTVRLPCGMGTAELRMPPTESPWYAGGGLGSLVGTGEVPAGAAQDRCATSIALNDAGRALVRPAPVRLLIAGHTGWHFQLR